MSEATAAPSTAASAAATTGTQANAGQTNTAQSQAKTSQATQAGGKVDAQTSSQEAQTQQDELEEVKIGSATAKVPKEFAKTIKALERGFQTKAQEAASYRQIMGNATPQQIAELAKDSEQFAEYILKTRGIDVDQYSQARLAKRLQREMMDPRDRELEEHRAYRAQKEKEEQEAKARSEQEKMTQAEQAEDQKLRSGLFEALKKSSLPSEGMTPKEMSYAAARAAAYMASSIEQGLNWTWEQCVARVEQESEHSNRSWVSKMDPETLEKKLGRDVLDKWREYDVKRVTGQSAPKASSQSRPAGSAASTKDKTGSKKALTEAEYREYFNNLAKSG